MIKITRTHIWILILTIIYTVIFGFLFFQRQNYEFLIYVGVLIFLILLISFLHLRFNFPTFILWGMSLWGFIHMSGGYFIINGLILYEYQIIPIILKYDQFAHLYVYIFVTLLVYHILKPYLKKEKTNWIVISILLIFIGMGIGSLNEILEFCAVLFTPQTGVGGYENTLWDLVFNTIGAIIAVVLINVKRKNSLGFVK